MRSSLLKAGFIVPLITILFFGCGKKESESTSSATNQALETQAVGDSIGTEANGNSTDFTKAVEIMKKVPGIDRSPKYHELFPVFSTGKSINAVEYAVVIKEKSKPAFKVAIMDAHSIPPDSAIEATANILPSRSDDASFPEVLKPLCFGSCTCYNKEDLYVFVYGKYSGNKVE